jgi:Pectate lyase superfamily protein
MAHVPDVPGMLGWADGVDATVAGHTAAMAGKVDKSAVAINVRDWGATGDGTTDDTVAIQDAIDYCIANTRAIYFPAGVYCVTPVLGYEFAAYGHNKYAMRIAGDLRAIGDGEASVIRTQKLGGGNPDGSQTGYVGAFGILATAATTWGVEMRDLVIDGATTVAADTTDRFYSNHKAIMCWADTSYVIPKVTLAGVTMKNFEGEGAHAPNGIVTRASFDHCTFTMNHGSSGNISGDTTYTDCTFVDTVGHGIEDALEHETGSLTVERCRFMNGSGNLAAIAVINESDPFSGYVPAKYVSRTGTTLKISDSTFEYTRAWLEATGAIPHVACITFAEVGVTIIENNTFRNAAAGPGYGGCVITVREWNDQVFIRGNTFIVNDSWFLTSITYSDNCNGVYVEDNRYVAEYPLAAAFLGPAELGVSVKNTTCSGNKYAYPTLVQPDSWALMAVWVLAPRPYSIGVRFTVPSSMTVTTLVSGTYAAGTYAVNVEYTPTGSVPAAFDIRGSGTGVTVAMGLTEVWP